MELSKEFSDELFQRFWLAGMRKVNKKKTKPLFNRLLKEVEDPEMFTSKLMFDVQRRINANQLGFDQMHPTTYLNGERWEDEIIENQIALQKTSTLDILTDRSWADGL